MLMNLQSKVDVHQDSVLILLLFFIVLDSCLVSCEMDVNGSCSMLAIVPSLLRLKSEERMESVESGMRQKVIIGPNLEDFSKWKTSLNSLFLSVKRLWTVILHTILVALAGYTRNAVVFWASLKLTLILTAEDTLLMSALLLIENVQNGFWWPT